MTWLGLGKETTMVPVNISAVIKKVQTLHKLTHGQELMISMFCFTQEKNSWVKVYCLFNPCTTSTFSKCGLYFTLFIAYHLVFFRCHLHT